MTTVARRSRSRRRTGGRALAEGLNPPTDPDNDGVFEDLNGNGRLDFNDVVVLFENLPDAETPFQDINENGRIDFDDIVELFKEI